MKTKLFKNYKKKPLDRIDSIFEKDIPSLEFMEDIPECEGRDAYYKPKPKTSGCMTPTL